jgi:glycine C-acetyltransferase
MLYDAKLSQTMADELLKKGVYVIGSSLVPKDKARIRVQLSAAHQRAFRESNSALVSHSECIIII